jgi:hypothetical protein
MRLSAAHLMNNTKSPKIGYRWYNSSDEFRKQKWQAFTNWRFRKVLKN